MIVSNKKLQTKDKKENKNLQNELESAKPIKKKTSEFEKLKF